MTTTKIKPNASGSFTAVTLDGAGRATTSDTTIGALAPANVVQALQAANEWHNQPGNTAATMAAQKRAQAVGVTLQEV